MANQQILEKAIAKAIEGGWDKDKARMLSDLRDTKAVYWAWVQRSFIFDHDFAKALWGEEAIMHELKDSSVVFPDLIAWKYHLQQMVIADDPIKYLGDNT